MTAIKAKLPILIKLKNYVQEVVSQELQMQITEMKGLNKWRTV